MRPARVMLVDDDASIRRFVQMALEGADVDLVTCASVAEALDELRARGPVALLITDLMMPGESGLALLQHLTDAPALRGSARLAVFSAGLHAAQGALVGFDIWRQLDKPVSVAELEACIHEAVAPPEPDGAPLTGGDPASPGGRAGSEDGLSDHALGAVATHFGGDRALFLAFRTSCRGQFETDLARGEASLSRQDLADLRHLAHSLKSVLTLLGERALAQTARELEHSAAHGDCERAPALWAALSSGLAALLADQP